MGVWCSLFHSSFFFNTMWSLDGDITTGPKQLGPCPYLCTSSWHPLSGGVGRWACVSLSKTNSGPAGLLERWWRNWRRDKQVIHFKYQVSVSCVCLVGFLRCFKPVFAETDHAAVVLIASPRIQHAGVDNVSNRNIQVIGTQMLQQLQGLVPRWLRYQERPEIPT